MATVTKISIPSSIHEVIKDSMKSIEDSRYEISKNERIIEANKIRIISAIEEVLPQCRNNRFKWCDESMTVEILDKEERPSLIELLKMIPER
jgi:hypothetical protein